MPSLRSSFCATDANSLLGRYIIKNKFTSVYFGGGWVSVIFWEMCLSLGIFAYKMFIDEIKYFSYHTQNYQIVLIKSCSSNNFFCFNVHTLINSF